MALTEDTPLTGKQPAFVDHYIACGFNATEAAARAGYNGDRRTLAAIGSENLAKPHIRATVKQRLEEVAMQRDEALARLGQLARATFAHLISFPEDGSEPYIDLRKARDQGALNLIKSFKQTEIVIRHNEEYDETILQRKTTVKLHDALRALIHIVKETQLPERGSTGEDGQAGAQKALTADHMASLAQKVSLDETEGETPEMHSEGNETC